MRKTIIKTIRVTTTVTNVCPKCGNSLFFTCQDCKRRNGRVRITAQRTEWRVW